jgi:hypothetical protein
MSRRGSSGGFATVLIAGVLGLLSTLALLGWAGATLAEQRAAGLEARSVEARAAAEAGIAWALARFNEPHPHDGACLAAVGGTGLWQRRFDEAAAGAPGGVPAVSLHVRTTPATATPSSWACFRDGSSWRCDCPADGAAAWSPGWLAGARSAGVRRAAFAVSVQGGVDTDGRPVARLVSTGCVDRDAGCVPSTPGLPVVPGTGSLGLTASTARVSVDLAVAPVLHALPAAALASIGEQWVDPAAVLVNPDPASGGRVLWAGAGVQAAGASILGQPGAPWTDRVAERDPWIAARSPETLVEAVLGLPEAAWAGLGRVSRVDCRVAPSPCGARVDAAIRLGATAVQVQGDLDLPAGLSLGAPGAGVLLVVDGALRIAGPRQVHGLALARHLVVDARTGPVAWYGAAVSTSSAQVLGPVHLERDAALLASLAHRAAAVVPAVAGWREY